MTTANKITIGRIILVPAFILLMLLDFPGHKLAALIVFIVAGASDSVDGYVARKYNQVTDFGKFADPLADKILIVSALLIFVQWGQMPAWCAIIIVMREFAVTGLRLIAVENGLVIAAAMAGKLKTFFSTIGCCIMLTPLKDATFFGVKALSLNNVCVAVMVILTVWSGCEYFVKNAHVLKNTK